MESPFIVSPEHCQGVYWQPEKRLVAAQAQSLIPLHVGELAKAAASMPLALVKRDTQWQLVGVCGTHPNKNLFVHSGRWLGHYRPHWLVTHPFTMVAVGDKHVVTLAPDSELLSAAKGEPFFNAAGEPEPALKETLTLLLSQMKYRRATQQALAALHSADVITPWPDALLETCGMDMQGLHRVDEKALNRLTSSQFIALRHAHALPLAYAVNFSLAQTHLLKRLARLSPDQAPPPENLDVLFGDDEDLELDFGP